MISFDYPEEKVIVCGDLVYKYEMYGELRPRMALTPFYPGSQMYIKHQYRLYLKNRDSVIADKLASVEAENLPPCLADVFLLTTDMFGINSSSESNLAISRRKLRDLVYSNFGINSSQHPMPLFITLTYAIPQFSPAVAKTQYASFIKRLHYHFGSHLRIIGVPEKHQSRMTRSDRYGSFHYHLIIFGFPQSLYGNKILNRSLQDKITDIWGFGFSYLKVCYGSAFSVAGYVTKYLEKDLSIEVGRRYLYTRNCWKPIILTMKDDLSTLPPLLFLSSSTYTCLSGQIMRLTINKIKHF